MRTVGVLPCNISESGVHAGFEISAFRLNPIYGAAIAHALGLIGEGNIQQNCGVRYQIFGCPAT